MATACATTSEDLDDAHVELTHDDAVEAHRQGGAGGDLHRERLFHRRARLGAELRDERVA